MAKGVQGDLVRVPTVSITQIPVGGSYFLLSHFKKKRIYCVMSHHFPVFNRVNTKEILPYRD